MKIKNIVVATLLSSTLLSGVEHSLEFGDVVNTHETNEYGEAIYTQSMVAKSDGIVTKGIFKEENSFSDNVSIDATIELYVSTLTACSLNGALDAAGCSGQRPFLINNEAVPNVGGSVSLAFQPILDDDNNNQYISTESQKFYPLDIARAEAYYSEGTPSEAPKTAKTFLGFITGSFDQLFSNTIGFGNDFFGGIRYSNGNNGALDTEASKRRQRYIANIVAGVEQNERLRKGETVISTSGVNEPVSLLHYAKAIDWSATQQCSTPLTSMASLWVEGSVGYDPNSVMCRTMNGFGMDGWIPFFSSNLVDTNITTDTIVSDTETALLALAGVKDDQRYNDVNDVSGLRAMMSEMIKPMSTMFNMMTNIMFGSSPASAPVLEEIDRNFAEPITLTMAVTNDGSKIDGFVNFQLNTIHTIVGDSMPSCTIRKTPGMMSWSNWTNTFYPPDSSLQGPTVDGRTNNQWYQMCVNSRGSSGFFSSIFNWSSGGFFNPVNWMTGMMSAMWDMMFGSISITAITTEVKTGLILSLTRMSDDLDIITTSEVSGKDEIDYDTATVRVGKTKSIRSANAKNGKQ